MGFGGVLAQVTYETTDTGAAMRALGGQVLGFLAVVAFGYWLMRRSRANRADRLPPSGWYADPWGGPVQRWWNGDAWTGHVRPDPTVPAWYSHPGPPPGGPPGGPGFGGGLGPPPQGPPGDGPPPADRSAPAP